jgi:hypothetical protein
MPDKYLVEFLAQWIRDESLRRRVLLREIDTMREWGLTAPQSADLRSLDKTRILNSLEKELKDDFGIDLSKILQDFAATPTATPVGFSAGAVYQQGRVHVRGVDPAGIKMGTPSIVIVRGHGWDRTLKVHFVPVTVGAAVDGTLLEMDCDVDVWQRATVKVTLPTIGKWRVVARIPANPIPDSTEDVQLDVA